VKELVNNKPKVLVIVGPTASGKTSLSIQLAKKFNGEVISADSRQVYKGLDIGTGKVTKNEMGGIPHHLLDVADPKETYTVADFVRDGRNAIEEIISRGKLPIIVGGTFLYVDSLLGKISTPEVAPNLKLREHLETLSNETLFTLLKEKDPQRAQTIDSSNKRRLVRALEIIDSIGLVPDTKTEDLYNPLFIGITISKEKLFENISKRLTDRIAHGMVEEVQNLLANNLSFERLAELGIEYTYTIDFLQNKISKEEMQNQIVTKSVQYAKRQMTWLKRNAEIHWLELEERSKIEKLVEDFLSNKID
jgi:tRNA dimethylallyltransferase